MSTNKRNVDFNRNWVLLVKQLYQIGTKVKPRDKLTFELLQRTITVNMRQPVLTIPERKLSYQFMAAEAYWILSGDNKVSTIAPYNKHISKFSDDGEVFAGAYGPKIAAQLHYVTRTLIDDPDSRQAGLTIWERNPSPSKDIPCTVTIFFTIRDGYLNCHVMMRSSDVWLGLPYDVFNFSMLGHLVCTMLQGRHFAQSVNPIAGTLEPGILYLTMMSSHLYETDVEKIHPILNIDTSKIRCQQRTPYLLFTNTHVLYKVLKDLRETKPDNLLRWWELRE